MSDRSILTNFQKEILISILHMCALCENWDFSDWPDLIEVYLVQMGRFSQEYLFKVQLLCFLSDMAISDYYVLLLVSLKTKLKEF